MKFSLVLWLLPFLLVRSRARLVWGQTSGTLTCNTFLENTAGENASTGFLVSDFSNGNILDGNRADDNGLGGFFLQNSSGNTIKEYKATSNDGNGFQLKLSSNQNTLDENRSDENGEFGYLDNSSGTGTTKTANIYTQNRCNGNQLCGSSPSELCTAQP